MLREQSEQFFNLGNEFYSKLLKSTQTKSTKICATNKCESFSYFVYTRHTTKLTFLFYLYSNIFMICYDKLYDYEGPWRGVWVSGVDLKFCVMSGVDLGMRLSVSGWSGVSSVGSPILSVGVGRHQFWVECQCRMEKMAQCRVSEYPLHGPYYAKISELIHVYKVKTQNLRGPSHVPRPNSHPYERDAITAMDQMWHFCAHKYFS